MDTLKCPIKNEDEVKIFKEVLQSLRQRSPQEMSNVFQQLTEVNKKRIRSLLQSATVQYTDEHGQTQKVARRIVKVVRRQPPGSGAQ